MFMAHSIHPTPTPPLQPQVQLLHKLKVRSADGKATLLKIIKNPITRHLPAGCKVYGFSVQGTLYNPMSLACTLPQDKPVVFVLGAMAAGHITVNDHPYIEEMISVSDFPVRVYGVVVKTQARTCDMCTHAAFL